MHSVYTKSLTRTQRREQWQGIITDWRESGLKRKVFCEQQQIKLADLRRWAYRLNQSQKPRLTATAKHPIITQEIGPSLTFVPVEMAPLPDTSVVNSLQLQHQSGFSLAISTHTDEQLIKKAIKLLKEAGC